MIIALPVSTCGKIVRVVIMSMMFLSLSAHAGHSEEIDAGHLLVEAIKRYRSVESYTCMLDKRVAKSGKLHEDLTIRVKFKKPANYYFRWEEGKRRGREVIFAAGRNEDRIVAHPGGWFRFMTLHLNPEGHLAMKENRHSLRNSGLGKIMQIVEADYHRSRQQRLNPLRFMGENRIDNRAVWVIQGQFPEGRGFYARRVVLFIDQTLNLPIKVSIYDGSETLVEEYVFHQLEINVHLSVDDFDPANPAYDFLEKDKK